MVLRLSGAIVAAPSGAFVVESPGALAVGPGAITLPARGDRVTSLLLEYVLEHVLLYQYRGRATKRHNL